MKGIPEPATRRCKSLKDAHVQMVFIHGRQANDALKARDARQSPEAAPRGFFYKKRKSPAGIVTGLALHADKTITARRIP
jgi:hypothetical protein